MSALCGASLRLASRALARPASRQARGLPHLLLLATPMFAAVSGTVINETAGKPQPNTTVTLYKLGSAGPESIESVKSDASGAFTINQNLAPGPHLVQGAYDGVTYNLMLFPGRPSTGLRLAVYDSSTQKGDAKVTTHMILVEPNGTEASVSESVIWTNDGKTTFYDVQAGSFRFALPETLVGKTRVTCTHPGSSGVPIERAAEKTGTPGVFKLDFPIKPGETRFDISYTVPLANPGKLAGKVIHGGGPVRLVAPLGVTFAGDSVEKLGEEPRTQASVYELKKTTYSIDVQGVGALRAPEAEAGEQDESPGIQQIRPRLYDRFYPILALTALILLTGMALLYRKQA